MAGARPKRGIHSRHLAVHVAEHLRGALRLGERNGARHGFVEQAAERVDVGTRIDWEALKLLGCHVVERADELTGLGHARCRGRSRHAEVGYQRTGFTSDLGDEDVRRLDVAMDEPSGVHGVEPGSRVLEKADRALR
ncbi:MAG: hypothetical protein R2700_05945 [Solirubrobacterales bacterium]